MRIIRLRNSLRLSAFQLVWLLYQWSSSGTLSLAALKRRVLVELVMVLDGVCVCVGFGLLVLQVTEYDADALNAFPTYIFMCA
jgi:fatty acid-binding protein DegV